MLNEDDFGKQRKRLNDAGFNVSEETWLDYYKALKKADPSDFQEMITKIIQEEDKLPKVPKMWWMLKHLDPAPPSEPTLASFRCEHCDLDFAVPIVLLGSEKLIKCDSCEYYYHRDITYSLKYLQRLYLQEKESKKRIGDIPAEVRQEIRNLKLKLNV